MSTILPAIDERAGVIDELQAWYLARAERDGWVYTSVLRQLINRMYRERDYLAQRKRDGRRTAYDYAVDREQVALAWAIRALVRHLPLDQKQQLEPPKPPRAPKRRLSAEEKAKYRGVPSWNGQPKRGWAGIELPQQSIRRPPPAPRTRPIGGASAKCQSEHPRGDAEQEPKSTTLGARQGRASEA